MILAETDPDADPRTEQFRAIYRAEFEFVWAVARRFGVPPAALDDVVQEVFLTAYLRLHQLRFEVSPRAWLYAVTRRVAGHHHRGASRLARRVAAFAQLSPRSTDVPHERHEAAQWLECLLARLPRGSREVWEMTEVLGMSGPEIAGELEVPLNTVYSRLRLARARLTELSTAPETVAACAAAVRRAEAPPPDAARRNWAVMLPMLGQGAGVPAIVGAWATSRAAMAVTLIVVGAAVVAFAPVLAPAPERAAPAAAPGDLRPISGATSGRGARATPPTDAAALPAPASGAAGLAAEVTLIDRARAHLAADAADAAFAWLAEHAREFPDGVLRDAREAARVEAHCLRGERAEADAAARRLVAQFPGSLVARRFQRFVCTP